MKKIPLKIKYILGAVFLFAVAFLLINYLSSFFTPSNSTIINHKQMTPSSVTINNIKVFVEVVTGSLATKKGLSGRVSLNQDRGMLFVFNKPDKYRFWMPNMNFPIDIIWIDENYTVVGITENISPEVDLKNPRFYTPPKSSQYVLEVNVGFIENHRIKIGDKVIFN